jgi:hypothetical protein
VKANVNLNPLKEYFKTYKDSDTIVEIQNWSNISSNSTKLETNTNFNHYFLGELLNERYAITILLLLFLTDFIPQDCSLDYITSTVTFGDST